MSKSRLGPEAKIITLFAALPEDSRRIVLDVIKSQSAAPRKAASKKPAASPLAPKELAESVTVPPGLCSHKFENDKICLAAADNAIHDPEFEYAGHHEFEPPKSVARAPRKSKPKVLGVQPTQ